MKVREILTTIELSQTGKAARFLSSAKFGKHRDGKKRAVRRAF